MDVNRWLVACVFLVIALAEDSPMKRSGLIGQMVKLPCSVPHSLPPSVVVSWSDRVYSSTSDPILIFHSENNPDVVISSEHPNRENFSIDRKDFELRIWNLTRDSAGLYSCSGESAGRRFRRNYFLTVHGDLTCTGKTQLQEGQGTRLTCKVAYTGNKPSLEWFYHENGSVVDSVDRSDLTEDGPTGEQELQVKASPVLDDKVFRCRMDFGDKTEDCHLRFNVSYPVRDVEFTATRNEFRVGEEVGCSARGNPAPEIGLSLIPTSVEEIPDNRLKSRIIIPKNWEGSEITMECIANNTYKGKLKTSKKSITFQVLAATTLTTLKTTPKPTEPAKAVLDGGENGAERRRSVRMMLSFVAMSLTLKGLGFSLRC